MGSRIVTGMQKRRRQRRAGRLAVWTATLLSAWLSINPAVADDPAAAPDQPSARPSPPLKLWQPVGRIQHEELTECSGIVASRQHPGIFWVHNDSGHHAVLYAIRESGEVVAVVPVAGAINIDWEDIADDDQGHLYIADTGNNYGMFPVRCIYQVEEPDPAASPVKPARVIEQYKYSYAGNRFDAEALFVRGGRLWIVSKPRGGQSAVYRLDPNGESKHQPTQIASLPFRAATGADLSADGKRLVICTPRRVYVFAVDDHGAPLTDPPPMQVRYPGGSIEACCFDGEDVILASEKGNIYRISAEDLAAGTRFLKAKQMHRRGRRK